MAFTGPYPTKFSGHTNAMVISATAFSGGVTNAGTIGPGGGVIITSSTFLTGAFVNTNLISGTANGISVLSDSTIAGAIVDSGTIRATKDGILVSGGVVSGGIQVGSHGTISAGSSAIVVTNTTTFAGGITNSGTGAFPRRHFRQQHLDLFGRHSQRRQRQDCSRRQWHRGQAGHDLRGRYQQCRHDFGERFLACGHLPQQGCRVR